MQIIGFNAHWRSLVGLASLVGCLAVAVAPATLSAQQSEPVYLDEPEAPPAPKIVQRSPGVEQKYPDGALRAKRDLVRMSDDQLVDHGAYTEYYPSGSKFAEGTFNMGVHDGQWTFWHENGQVCKTVTFKDGLAHGTWDVFDEEGRVVKKKSYDMGQRDGLWVYYYPGTDTPQMEMPMKDGKMHGERVYYFESGKVRQRANFKEGLLHGVSEEWDEAGRQLAKVSYANGKLDGEAVYWDSEGEVTKRVYQEGEIVRAPSDGK